MEGNKFYIGYNSQHEHGDKQGTQFFLINFDTLCPSLGITFWHYVTLVCTEF
jgi:hypothetical protein